MMLEEVTIKALRPGRELENVAADVWHILETVNKDFIPPLSSRTDTTAHDLSAKVDHDRPTAFFESIMTGHVLLACADDKAVAFMGFIPRYSDPMLEDWAPCTYISVVAVLPEYRRRGIAQRLNDTFEQLPVVLESPYITRRTWSTNQANLTLLKSRGFEEIIRLPDHREPGVDTIYLARRTVPGQSL